MKESKFLGALLPSSPDFAPIMQTLRDKYQLPEVSPQDDPISEIYLLDELVSLGQFHQEIKELLKGSSTFLNPETAKFYRASADFINPVSPKEFDKLPDDLKTTAEAFVIFAQNIMRAAIQAIVGFVNKVADMLYIYLLTGETQQTPDDWFGAVTTLKTFHEPIVIAKASQISDP